mgnify:CR=1 FL=1
MKILLVEDDLEISKLLAEFLQENGYEVFCQYDGLHVLDCLRENKIDLILLDIMLPYRNGDTVLSAVRECSTVPIIVISAKGTTQNKVDLLRLGADDYITKPFLPLELVARVKAQLRRYKKYNVGAVVPAANEIFKYAGLTMNIKTYECRLNGEALSLTPTEFSILRILLERRCSVVSAEELFHEVWQEEYYTKSNNTITVHIRHLREKMKDTGENPRYIKTVWGVGYKIGEI